LSCASRFDKAAGARRLRVGDYRVIYTIEPPDIVVTAEIGHRRDVYDHSGRCDLTA